MSAPACESLPLDRLRPRPIIAWRCWFVHPDELLLRPIYRRGLAWKPRRAMEAICPDEPHLPPETGCKCGIWTVRAPAQLEEIHWTVNPPGDIAPLPGVLVVGQVALWGEIVEHERGWRAARAYPTHLYAFTDDAELAALLRDRYLVPVEFGERAEALRARLPKLETETPPAAAAPPSRPAAPRATVIRQAVIDRLPDGPLKAFATECLRGLRLGNCGNFRLCLRRTEYHLNSYGTLVDGTYTNAPKAKRHDAVARAAAARAGRGDITAARRVVWLMIASRWRRAQKEYRYAVEAEVLAKRRKSLTSGKPLAASTMYQRQAGARGRKNDLRVTLTSLALVPTPTYREWRAMVAR